MLNTMITILLLAGACYGLLLLTIYMYQPKMLYFPDEGDQSAATPSDVGLTYQQVELRTTDDLRLSAWYLPAEDEQGVLLFCHGNAGNISHRLDSLLLFHHLQMSVLIFDYRGYGQSEGQPSEQGTYTDALAAWEYLLTQKSKQPAEIVIFGRSLGAAIAAELATRVRPGALILESAFTSVPDLASEIYPFLPVRLLSRFSYDTRTRLDSLASPLLIIHSNDDEIIPYSHAQRLYAAAHEPKHLLNISGGHNDGFLVSGNRYTEGLRRFLHTHLPPP